ncbi:hypothetical protein R6Q57_012007 [Mikania cordata]
MSSWMATHRGKADNILVWLAWTITYGIKDKGRTDVPARTFGNPSGQSGQYLGTIQTVETSIAECPSADSSSSLIPESLILVWVLVAMLSGLQPSDVGLVIKQYNSELKAVNMASRRNVNYTRLAVDEDYVGREGTFDPRFDMAAETLDKVPWKSIVLALSLLFFGSVLLLLSLFIFTGHMNGDRSQAYGLFGLGTLAFLPGFYETRIAYYSWRGVQGYHFAAIPGFAVVLLLNVCKGFEKGRTIQING